MKAQIYQTVLAIILGLVSLGVFAMKSDVESLRADVYKNFAAKDEVSRRLDALDNKIDDIKRILIERK